MSLCIVKGNFIERQCFWCEKLITIISHSPWGKLHYDRYTILISISGLNHRVDISNSFAYARDEIAICKYLGCMPETPCRRARRHFQLLNGEELPYNLTCCLPCRNVGRFGLGQTQRSRWSVTSYRNIQWANTICFLQKVWFKPVQHSGSRRRRW